MAARNLLFGSALAFLVSAGVAGHVAAMPAGTISYTYDAAGRLTSATYPDGTCLAYTWDAAGNRTQYVSATTPVVGAVAATVAANTSNDPIALSIACGAPTSVTVTTGAGHGVATASGVAITYTPNGGYSGRDSFSYSASNAGGSSSPAGVTVTVQPPMVATIAAGPFSATAKTLSYTFPTANTVTVTGGSGSYNYAWSETDDHAGTWTSGGELASFTPAVTVPSGGSSTAIYTVMVTDTATGRTATSNTAGYQYTQKIPGG